MPVWATEGCTVPPLVEYYSSWYKNHVDSSMHINQTISLILSIAITLIIVLYKVNIGYSLDYSVQTNSLHKFLYVFAASYATQSCY